MSCQNPISVLSPESRWLKKCRKEGRSYEYYLYQANQRRNIIYDPVILCNSPKEYYDSHFCPDYRKMQVPCGHCDGCMKDKVNDLFVRLYFEWIRCVDAKNGSVWLGTLTYEDSQLPRTEDGVPCFDKRHVQLFFKRLRKRSDLKFKVFYVTEYGGEFGRPHYHFILFVEDFLSSDSNKFRLLQWVAESWTKIEDRNYNMSSMNNIGLFNMQRVDVKPVYDSKGLRYVSKYIAKQFGTEDFLKLDLEGWQSFFYQCSVGLGDCILEYANRDMWQKGYIECDGYKYRIPSYYKLKMEREYFCTFDNGQICYKPSDEGLFYNFNLCLRQIEECRDLARLNPDFPNPPAWVFDPCTMEYVKSCFEKRMFEIDFSEPAFRDLMSEWLPYLEQVQSYNKCALDARVNKWNEQRKNQYLKKTGKK